MSLLPAWVKWLGIAALLGVIGVQFVAIKRVEARFADARSAWADERQAAAETLARTEADYRAREESMRAEHRSIDDAKQAQIDDVNARLGRAVSLRDAATAAAQRAKAACGAASEPSGATAGDAIGMLGRVLAESDERAGIVAAYADRERIGHEACVAEYASVRDTLSR